MTISWPIDRGPVVDGSIVEVSMAYSHETGDRTIMDEIACCEAEVLKLHADGTADVYVKALGEWNVHVTRLKRLR